MSLVGRPGRPAGGLTVGFRGGRAFRYRNYRLFFSGQAVSLIGTWMQQVAQAWLVLQLTGDALMLGVVAAAQFVPVIILGLFGGVIADQLPKRRTLVATQTIAMILAFALFALTVTNVVEVWQILVLAILLGVSNAVDMPTRQAFAAEMVGRDDLRNAVALNSAMFNGARILGPAVAGITIGLTDISVAFLLNGLSFLPVILSLAAIRESELRPFEIGPRPRGVRGVLGNLAEGLVYVWRTPIVLLAVTVVGLVATLAMNFQVLVPVLAQDVLGTDASGYGFLMAASGVGSLAAALGVAFARRVGPRPIAAGALVLGVASIVLAWSQAYAVSLAAMVAAGGGGIAMAVTANTTIQATVPDQLRGRVMSVYTTVFSASVPLGGIVMGAVASWWGVPVALALGGGLTLGVAAWALAWLGRIRAAGSVPVSAPLGSGPVDPSIAAFTRSGRR